MTGRTCAALLLCGTHLVATAAWAASGPFDGKTFRGRIAYSADGNFNDADDWAASPVALAILAGFGIQERLVHFDYNCILSRTDPAWEKEHAAGVLGAAERFGFDRSAFHDCRKDLAGAVDSIARAVNASSAEDPLYFILAGPMDVPLLGLSKADAARRRFVTCISHSRWNDGFARTFAFTHTKRDVIAQGVTWIQIADQNRSLAGSPYGRPARPREWAAWHWMRDSADPNVRFLWDRLQISTRPDCSDAGMAYFLLSGDEDAGIAKLKALLEDKRVPTPVMPRTRVRLEAENFRTLEAYAVEYTNDRSASHRLSVRPTGAAAGCIRTRFDEPYVAPCARYDVDVRYAGGEDGRCELALHVAGAPQGEAWRASGTDRAWTTHTVRNVILHRGDEIAVVVRGGAGKGARLDYVQLNCTGPASDDARPNGERGT